MFNYLFNPNWKLDGEISDSELSDADDGNEELQNDHKNFRLYKKHQVICLIQKVKSLLHKEIIRQEKDLKY